MNAFVPLAPRSPGCSNVLLADGYGFGYQCFQFIQIDLLEFFDIEATHSFLIVP
jgi:hypothetical protein